jgi:hypothetical protein
MAADVGDSCGEGDLLLKSVPVGDVAEIGSPAE